MAATKEELSAFAASTDRLFQAQAQEIESLKRLVRAQREQVRAYEVLQHALQRELGLQRKQTTTYRDLYISQLIVGLVYLLLVAVLFWWR